MASGSGEHRPRVPRFSLAQRVGKKEEPLFEITVPARLNLEGAHTETCDFVWSIRQAVRARRRVLLDFSKVESIRASALTYLLGQIHKLRLEFGDDCVTGTYPESARVERALAVSGFYDLLKVKSRDAAVSTSRTMRYIRFKTDQKINGAEIGKVREELLGADLSMPSRIAKTIFRAVSEAMTNVNHHAYFQKQFVNAKAEQRLSGRWWLFATLNVPGKMFSVVFYDAGVGIPKTLPRRYPAEVIMQVLSQLPGIIPNDGQMIAAAMVLGRTRTDMDNRGKGLMDLAKLIDQVGAGKMQIFSRQGRYSYSSGVGSHSSGRGRLEGTLIEWRLPLDMALDALPEELQNEAAIDS